MGGEHDHGLLLCILDMGAAVEYRWQCNVIVQRIARAFDYESSIMEGKAKDTHVVNAVQCSTM